MLLQEWIWGRLAGVIMGGLAVTVSVPKGSLCVLMCRKLVHFATGSLLLQFSEFLRTLGCTRVPFQFLIVVLGHTLLSVQYLYTVTPFWCLQAGLQARRLPGGSALAVLVIVDWFSWTSSWYDGAQRAV